MKMRNDVKQYLTGKLKEAGTPPAAIALVLSRRHLATRFAFISMLSDLEERAEEVLTPTEKALIDELRLGALTEFNRQYDLQCDIEESKLYN